MDLSHELYHVVMKNNVIADVLQEYELLAAVSANLERNSLASSSCNSLFSNVANQTSSPVDIVFLCTLSQNCGNIWTVREGVDWLIYYLFFRRYGWDDIVEKQTVIKVLAPTTSQRLRTGSREQELQFKERIVNVAGDIILWLEQRPLSLLTLKMFNSAIKLAKGHHATRQHLMLHTIRWLTLHLEQIVASPHLPTVRRLPSSTEVNGRLSNRRGSACPALSHQSSTSLSLHLPDDATPETMYYGLRDLILLTTGDGNSAVRRATIFPVSHLLSFQSFNTVNHLLNDILTILDQREKQSTESCDGLLHAVGLLMKRAIAIESTTQVKTNDANTASSDVFVNKLMRKIRSLVFSLFSDSESTLRITAVKLYFTCLKRCPPSVVESALDDIMVELCGLAESHGLPAANANHIASVSIVVKESVLSLCQLILQEFQLCKLPVSTGDLQNCLVESYMWSGDVIVRVAAAKLYESLISNSLDNVNRVRYLLHKLVENWPLDRELLKVTLSKSIPHGNGFRRPVSVTQNVSTAIESRLSIFENIAQILVHRHLSALAVHLGREAENHPKISQCSSLPIERNIRVPSGLPQRPVPLYSRRSMMVESFKSPEDHSNDSVTSSEPSPVLLRSFTTPGSKPKILLFHYKQIDGEENGRRRPSNNAPGWRGELVRRLSILPSKPLPEKQQVEQERCPLQALFVDMFNVCIRCIVVGSREVRQSARKSYAEVARLISWFDAHLTTDLLLEQLTLKPTLLSYGGLKMIRSALKDFSTYDRLFVNKDFAPTSPMQTDSVTSQGRMQSTSRGEIIMNGQFLNTHLLHALFTQERSSLWLEHCEHYASDDQVPTFIMLPAVDCILRTLSLVHLFPQFTEYSKLINKVVGKEMTACPTSPLAVDASLLADAVHSVVNMASQYEVVLDENRLPSTVTGVHFKLGSIRPYPLTPSKEERAPHSRLSGFLARLTYGLESVLFHYLPPSSNPTRPDTVTRRAAGCLLAPLLVPVISWPLALKPPGPIDLTSKSRTEQRILSVRRLLRLVAALVHSLPLAPGGKGKISLYHQPNGGEDSLPVQLDVIGRTQIDLTEVVNLYFTQLEKVLTQLVTAYHPNLLCQSTSWWWFRSLCEHVPRLMQVAPHANPVSLLRQLLDEVGQLTNSERSQFRPLLVRQGQRVKRSVLLWQKAIQYARRIATRRIEERRRETAAFAYRWPTVGVLLQSQDVMHTEKLPRRNSGGPVMQSEQRASQQVDRDSSSLDDQASIGQASDGMDWNDSHNPAFDQVSEVDECVNLEEAETDTSSGEELAFTPGRSPLSSVTQASLLRPRRRARDNDGLKPEPIGTPPPFSDIIGLVKRVWSHCQPVTVATLKNMLSSVELSMIVGASEKPART